MLKKVFLISLLMLFLFSSCKSPVTPDIPNDDNGFEPKFIEIDEVVYIREVPVRCPEAIDRATLVIKHQGGYSAQYKMEKVDEGKWKIYTSDKILVNYPEKQGNFVTDDHVVYVVDNKLWDGSPDPNTDRSRWTGYGIYFKGQKVPRVEKYENGSIGKFRIDESEKLY